MRINISISQEKYILCFTKAIQLPVTKYDRLFDGKYTQPAIQTVFNFLRLTKDVTINLYQPTRWRTLEFPVSTNNTHRATNVSFFILFARQFQVRHCHFIFFLKRESCKQTTFQAPIVEWSLHYLQPAISQWCGDGWMFVSSFESLCAFVFFDLLETVACADAWCPYYCCPMADCTPRRHV